MPMLVNANTFMQKWNNPAIQSISTCIVSCHKKEYSQQHHLCIRTYGSLNKKAKFIVIPIKAAKLVKIPNSNAIPTNTSPHGINTLKNSTFGKATCSKKVAHQL